MSTLKREESEDSLRQLGARSEYVKRYQVYPLQKTKSCKPPTVAVTSDQPLESITIQKRDYPPHPLEKRTAARPAPNNITTEGKHDFTSSYRNQFLDQPAEKRQPFKPSSERPNLAAFEATPSYLEDYPEWELPEKSLRQKIEWIAPEQPFVGQSTSNAEYPPHQISPRILHKPDIKPLCSEQPFMANSDYKDTFKAHELPPRIRREKESWIKPTDPFDTTTTQQRDFTGQYTAPQKSMRPDRKPIHSDAPLEIETTANASFVPFELPQRYRHEPESYKRPEGQMDLQTTNSCHYTSHTVHRHTVQKPGSSQILRGSGPMAKETNYLDSFLGTARDKVTNMKPKSCYEPPTVPMESKTVNKTDFHSHEISPQQNYAPTKVPLKSEQPFDDRTGYRDQFKEHPIPPRHIRPKEVYEESKVPLDTRTTVQDSFKGPYQPKRAAYYPDREPVMSTCTFQGQTTMNDHYKKHDVPGRQMRKPEVYKKPEGEMDLSTIHATTFTPHTLSRYTINKPGSSGLLKGQGQMSCVTNYQGDFVKRPTDRVKPMKPENVYEPPSQPMNTETTHQSMYSEKDFSKRQSCKPIGNVVISDVPFNDRTDYRDHFIQHETMRRKLREKETHQPPSAPLDARTTAQDSYAGAVQSKRDSFRPKVNYVRSDVPLDANTTSALSFKPWPAEKRFVHKPNEYVRPEGVMDFNTMNRDTYKEVRGERPTMKRPDSSHLLNYGGKFETSTCYRGDFGQKIIEGRKLVKPSREYQPPTVPFDSHTEYRSALVGYVAPKQKSFKPGNALSDTLGQRDVANPYRVRCPDWRGMSNVPPETTTVA